MFTLESVTYYLQTQLKANAPVRTKPPSGPHGKSPYPGNLQQNGINITLLTSTQSRITVGGDPAPYGPYTETKSHKPYWQQKSINETVQMLINRYGGVIK